MSVAGSAGGNWNGGKAANRGSTRAVASIRWAHDLALVKGWSGNCWSQAASSARLYGSWPWTSAA
jgi:hypothetical protein